MAPRSPPKRVTRARAAAKNEDVLSGPARKPAATKVQKTTVTGKKTKVAAKADERIEDELMSSASSPKTTTRAAPPNPGPLAAAPRRRLKVTPLNPAEQTAPAEKAVPQARKPVTRKKVTAKEEDKAQLPRSKPATAATRTASRSTRATKGTEAAAEAPVTRGRPKRASAKTAVEEAQQPATTRLTRTRAASNANPPSEPMAEKPKVKVAKKVTFENPPEEDKENRPVPAGKKAPAKKETPAMGIRAKPVRKPSSSSSSSSSSATAAPRATRGRTEKSPPRVLTPKKITQVNLSAAAAGVSDDEDGDDDELCGDKTPVRDLSVSPRRNPVLAAALSPVQRLDLNQSLLPRSPVKPVESVMTSPARRLPSPGREVTRGSPLRESPKRADLSAVLPSTSPQFTALVPPDRSQLLQSPKRVQLDASAFSHSSMKARQSPFKASLLGSPARRPASPKKSAASSAPQVSADQVAMDRPSTPENVTVTSNFRTSVSPARSGRVYRLSDEELADEMANEMDFDQSVLCVNSPLKVSKQALFKPETEDCQKTAADAEPEHTSEALVNDVPSAVDSEPVQAADPTDIHAVLPETEQAVVDETVRDAAASATSPSRIEVAVSDDEDANVEEPISTSDKGPSSPGAPEAHFRAGQPLSESDDELCAEKTPARGPRAFKLSLSGDTTRCRLSTGISSGANHNFGFTPLAAQMSRWPAASPEKKSVSKISDTRPLFSPIAAQHIDGEVVTSRHSTPRSRTPRSALSSTKRQSLAPGSLAPPVLASFERASPEKTSFFDDQMAGFEVQDTDQTNADLSVNFDISASIEERAGEGIAAAQREVEDGPQEKSDSDDSVLNSGTDGELTTDLIKFTNASSTAVVDFENLAREAEEMHEEANEWEDDEEYGDENTAPLGDMEVTEMIAHASAQEHFAEFPQCDEHDEQGTGASISPPQHFPAQPAAGFATPIQQDFSKPRYINTVTSKIPLRPEGQASPIKMPRKRARSLSNVAQAPTPKRSSLTSAAAILATGSPTPSPDRRIRSAAPSPAVTTPGRVSFCVDDFGDSTLDGISLGEEMMDFEVGNPDMAAAPPSSVKSAKTIQSSAAATPARTPLRPLGRDILSGTVIYVDVHTSEGADASGVYVDLLTQMGAKCVKEWRWNPRASLGAEDAATPGKVGITHVVYKDGGKRTLEKVRDAMGEVLCVGVRWVLDCEREQKWLDEAPYVVDHGIIPRGGSRRRKSMEPSRLSNLNGTVSAKAGRRRSSAEFMTSAMREDLIKTPVSGLRCNSDDDETEISSTYNSPTTTMNVKNAGVGFETPPELKNWDPATSATPVVKTPAQPNFRKDGEERDVLKSAPPKQLGERLFGGGSGGGSGKASGMLGVEPRRTTMGWVPRVRSPLGK